MSTLNPLRGEGILCNRVYLERSFGKEIKELVAVIVRLFGSVNIIAHPGTKIHENGQNQVTGAHVGRKSLTFFSINVKIENGGTGPDAFPSATIVPLRLMILKLLSKLEAECQMLEKFINPN